MVDRAAVLAELGLHGGWCTTCGEPVVLVSGTDECPTSAHGWRPHLYVENAQMTREYPVSIPVRVTAVGVESAERC